MPIDWLSQMKPAQIQGPDPMKILQAAGAMQTLQSGIIQNRLASMQADEAQKKMDKQSKMDSLFASTPMLTPARPADASGPTAANGALAQERGSSVNPDFINQYATLDPVNALAFQGHALTQEKNRVDMENAKLAGKKTESEIAFKNLEGAHKKLEILGGAAQSLIDYGAQNPGADMQGMYKQTIGSLASQGLLDPSTVPAVYDPAQLKMFVGQALSVKDQIAQKMAQQKADLEKSQFAETQRHNKAGESAATAARVETARHNKKTESSGDAIVSLLSPQTTEDLANKYLQTGDLPPMGFGKAAAGARAAVLNRASEIADANGDDANAQAIQAAAFKANKVSLNQISKQSGLAMSFERTANKNADLALQLSDKVDRTGSPVINRFALFVRGQYAGDPDVAAFNTAIKTFANEYAKVTTGQTGGTAVSDSARTEIDKLINASQNPAQLKSVISTMKQEMANRRAGYDEEISNIKKGMSNGGGKVAAPTDLNHFLTEARKKNPGVSDADLTNYYHKKYGGR